MSRSGSKSISEKLRLPLRRSVGAPSGGKHPPRGFAGGGQAARTSRGRGNRSARITTHRECAANTARGSRWKGAGKPADAKPSTARAGNRPAWPGRPHIQRTEYRAGGRIQPGRRSKPEAVIRMRVARPFRPGRASVRRHDARPSFSPTGIKYASYRQHVDIQCIRDSARMWPEGRHAAVPGHTPGSLSHVMRLRDGPAPWTTIQKVLGKGACQGKIHFQPHSGQAPYFSFSQSG